MAEDKEKAAVVGKTEIIADLVTKLEVTKKEAGVILSGVLSVIRARLENGENVRLIPFGSFEVRTRPAREGRNPATKEVIPIPERRVPVFRPGKELKKAVNGNKD